MTVGKGWGMAESHLLPDAVVAFVDQELSLGAQERAASHLARCPRCAAEVAAQRAASAAVRQARTPAISAGFLASLCEIPHTVELPHSPDSLAVGADGQVMAVQRPDQVAGLRESLPPGALGTSAPLGTSPNVLGNGPRLSSARRRATQGAGVVVSGLVLSALALVATTSGGEGPTVEADPESTATPRTDVLPAAKMGSHPTTYAPGGVRSTPSTPSGTSSALSTTSAPSAGVHSTVNAGASSSSGSAASVTTGP
ncbi:zf-HC2 domain-containing protein [Saccharomonospora xinjiangensis]|uniref:zf-HC2 domain-containing protein n=1 Tax=Saccharomonospora xinjiangensis TaxID=75294 RepID=UPI00106F9C26|nr:zf-HC2 domain-containing protein [Saccharomonospora xinjiangensis]QBQ59101.1 Anti-sigma-E factor RseA [Saccharomonospora xinjiangensis]